MSDDQTTLPGFGDGPTPTARPGRRTLQDLVDAHSDADGSHMDSFLAAPGNSPSGSLRLGFPSSDQLARFVAGQHARIFDGVPLPAPLRLIAGGHLDRKRFFAAGRSSSPDLVLTGPEGELVLVFVVSPLSTTSRLPDEHSLEVVAALGHEVHGVLVTPDPTPEVGEIITQHLATFPPAHRPHWVRYRIEMEIISP